MALNNISGNVLNIEEEDTNDLKKYRNALEDNLKEIDKYPVVFFGNEFLDALPIKQFTKINKIVFERHVALKKNKLKFFFKKAIKKQIDKLKT